jgi:hypothetical protein
MHDDYLSDPPRAALRGRANGAWLAAALIGAVALGGVASIVAGQRLGWIEMRGDPANAAPANTAVSSPVPGASPTNPTEAGAQAALGVRMAELEQRMTRLNLQAESAAGNAARAEGLLIAAAVRRAIERGAPLGYLEDQLKLRFGNAQPNAVETLIDAAAHPVTLDALEAGLRAVAPVLANPPSRAGTLARVRGELSNLFVIRKANAPSPAPERRLERARMFVETDRVPAAIGEVERMPGRAAAREWIELANRYVRTERALDLIETAAVLEPRQLQDAGGAAVTAPATPLP